MAKEQAQIIIAGGGTGGHVYPALCIADALKKIDPSLKIDFVGTQRGIESRLVPEKKYPIHYLNIQGLKNSSFFGTLHSLILIPIAIIQSMRIIFRLRPKLVVGVGGYASGPFLLASAFLGTRTAIWEPNAYPGLTNRWLSRFVQTAFVVYENAKSFFKSKKIVTCGMPLREGIAAHTRETHSALRIFVTGGSQGARGINKTISDAVVDGGHWTNDVEIIHQTGPIDFEWVKEKYKNAPKGFDVYSFVYDMEKKYSWADLVICRSGAGTLAELAAAKKASILIPFPFSSDNHQQKNAEALSSKNAATMVLQNEFSKEKFIELVEFFKKNKNKIIEFENKVAEFHRPHSADLIAEALIKEME